MDVLDVLHPFAGGVFPCSQVAVHDGDIGGVDLQEEGNCAFITKVILEASFDFLPFLEVDPVVKVATDEDKGSDSNHIVAGQVDIRLVAVGCELMEVGLHHLPPVVNYLVVVADQHVEGTQLHHLLQTDHQDVRLLHWEIKQLLLVLLPQLLWVHCIAVPSQDE